MRYVVLTETPAGEVLSSRDCADFPSTVPLFGDLAEAEGRVIRQAADGSLYFAAGSRVHRLRRLPRRPRIGGRQKEGEE